MTVYDNITPSTVSPFGKGMKAIFVRSVVQIVRRPVYWVGFIVIPMFLIIFFGSILSPGLPTRLPAAIVDLDGSPLSRGITQDLNGMQMIDLTHSCNSFSEARHLMQKGDIYGYFLIPHNFQSDLLAGRKPEITYYTNMTYFVPGSLLFKTFKTTAVYSKAGIAARVVQDAGIDPSAAVSVMQPINIVTRGIGNPTMNYAIYLANSFTPCMLQLMIMLMTAFSIGQEIKYKTSTRLLAMADGSIVKALFAKLLPQTVIWLVIVTFMTSWLYKYQHLPMNGSWFWLALSELLFVLASQAFAVFVTCAVPNLRLSLSLCALTGILSFSIAAFSFPEQSMYGAMSIFSWLMPVRYNFLIYADQVLNGIPVYYSRVWYAAYLVYLILPFTLLWNLKRIMLKPVYIP